MALEYIFYAKENGNYHRLIKNKVQKDVKNKNEQLGLRNFSCDERNGNNAFQEMPRFYSVLKKDYINEHVTAANYEHKQTTIEDDIGIAID